MYSVAKSMIAVFACTAAVEASADNSLTCDSAGNCMLTDELKTCPPGYVCATKSLITGKVTPYLADKKVAKSEAVDKDNWKLSGGFGGFGASVDVKSRLDKDVKIGIKGPGGL